VTVKTWTIIWTHDGKEQDRTTIGCPTREHAVKYGHTYAMHGEMVTVSLGQTWTVGH
jgi:hypothetical protein